MTEPEDVAREANLIAQELLGMPLVQRVIELRKIKSGDENFYALIVWALKQIRTY